MQRLIPLSLLLLSTLTCAQAQVPADGGFPAANGVGANSGSSAVPPAPIYDNSIAQVRDRLHLTEPQQQYWFKYVAKIDEYSKVYYQEKPVSAFKTDAAPRQIGRLIDVQQNRLAVMDEVEAAAKALYALLDPEQRNIADQYLISTIPNFASGSALCPPPSEVKSRTDRPEAGQRKRRGGMGG